MSDTDEEINMSRKEKEGISSVRMLVPDPGQKVPGGHNWHIPDAFVNDPGAHSGASVGTGHGIGKALHVCNTCKHDARQASGWMRTEQPLAHTAARL